MRKIALLGLPLVALACHSNSTPASAPTSAPPSSEQDQVAAKPQPEPVATPAPAPAPEPEKVLPVLQREVKMGRLASGDTLTKALSHLGVDADQSREVLAALAGVFDFRKAKAGDELLLTFEGQALISMVYRTPPLDEWRAARDGDRWVAQKREIQVEKKVVRVDVPIESSLYVSLQKTGADPELAVSLADVFAWDVDFYTDTQNGDEVRALVEEYVANGKVVRYGDVLGAEYVGKTVGDKKIFRYLDPSGEVSYFNPDGSSARKTFLKSPLKYAHITSKFGMRMHPLLGYTGMHQGIDFGAAPGTPVWAVGDGTVSWAGMKGPNGNMVCIKHKNGLESCYCHLQGYGEGIKTGVRVAQKKVIGYVGTTGLSTGPHLHYALKRNGNFLNPLSVKFPPSDPVPQNLLADFHNQIDPVSAQLNPLPVAQASVPAATATQTP